MSTKRSKLSRAGENTLDTSIDSILSEEEQLLALQQQFLNSGAPSAAKAVRKGEKNTSNYKFKRNNNFREVNYEHAVSYSNETDDTKLFTTPDFISDTDFYQKANEVQKEQQHIPTTNKQEEPTKPSPPTITKSKEELEIESLLEKCRFDFEGRMLTLEEQKALPTHLGLHHHGHNPEHAGYTFDEIFLLLRSLVPSQRSINLKLLTAIVSKAKSGYYSQQLGMNLNLLHYLIDKYDLLLVLILSLQENNQTVLMASLQLLHTFIVPHRENWEKIINNHIDQFPRDNPANLSDAEVNLKTEEGQLVMLSKLELFRYLTDMMAYGHPVFEQIVFSIVTHCCMTSVTVAKAIAQSRLIDELRRKANEMITDDKSAHQMQALQKLVSHLEGFES